MNIHSLTTRKGTTKQKRVMYQNRKGGKIISTYVRLVLCSYCCLTPMVSLPTRRFFHVANAFSTTTQFHKPPCKPFIRQYRTRNQRATHVSPPTILVATKGQHAASRNSRNSSSSSSSSSSSKSNTETTTTTLHSQVDDVQTTDGTSSDVAMTKDMLKKFTVKQLKEKIKALNLPFKTSQLKLKNDIIDFLYEKHYSTSSSSSSSSSSASGHDHNDHNDHNERHNDTMYKISSHDNDDEIRIQSSHNDSNTSSHQDDNQHKQISIDPPSSSSSNNAAPSQNTVSPRDIIFEHVMKRYPPLRDLQKFAESTDIEQGGDDSNSNQDNKQSNNSHFGQFESILSRNPHISKSLTGLGELDVRQEYHPMLKSMTSSDLDIVTVGTASCVPGVTRGVSCTALRLQWRRNNQQNNNDSKPNQKDVKKSVDNGMTTGGIWIFDCGESTQVSFLCRKISPYCIV